LPYGGTPLVELFWGTALSAASDIDVESWIASVRQLDRQQVSQLEASILAPDNATILPDNVWLREYRKDESERNWDRVEGLVRRIEEVGREIGLRVLETAAIRTRIMIAAEWRHDISGAVELATSALERINDNENRFLITEVTGRQFSYAGRSDEAIGWLERAHSFPISGHALWRRNVLITLAEQVGKSNPARAAKRTAEALALSRTALGEQKERVIEALAEHAIALWNAGERDEAFAMMQSAVRELLVIESGEPYWKKLFLTLFYIVIYYGSIAYLGTPPSSGDFTAPVQGRFLGLDNVDETKFVSAQLSFIRMRMAILAEGLGRVREAGEWSDEALRIAADIPDARTIYALAWISVAPALLRDDWAHAIRSALLTADADEPTASSLTRIGLNDPKEQVGVQGLFSHPAKGPYAMIFGAVPLAFRLMTLKLRGSQAEIVNEAIKSVSTELAASVPGEQILAALGVIFQDESNWIELKKLSDAMTPRIDSTAAGIVYLLGAAAKAPLPQALCLQAYLLRESEKLFAISPSTRRQIIYPFFASFWQHASKIHSIEFRTSEAYTRRSVETHSTPFSLVEVKRLLLSMGFCLGATLPGEIGTWLEDV
jgi:tetratricopeptide (TPR) repeat protein